MLVNALTNIISNNNEQHIFTVFILHVNYPAKVVAMVGLQISFDYLFLPYQYFLWNPWSSQ